MPAWLRNLTTTVLAFGASWTGAVWYWRADKRMPATGDLALYLLVVPVALLLLVWAIGRALRPAAAPAATAAVPAAPEQVAPPTAPVATLAVVAAAVRTPHGTTPGALAAALAEGSARPALDAELADDHGYPILAARVPGIDVAAVRTAFDGTPHLFDDAQWRALALGGAVADELAAHLALHPRLAEHAARIDPRAPSPLPLLHLHLAWADGWNEAQRAAAAHWLRARFVAAGWPEERIAPAAAEADPATLPARLLADAGPDTLAVLLAFASQLDTATIDALAAQDRLLTARTPHGSVPGEGAAGLLLAGAAQAPLLAPDAHALPALTAHVSEARTGKPGRADAPALGALCTRALAQARCAPERVALVAADAAHHADAVLELMGTIGAQLPHLDPAADLARSGDACGACAPVPWLAALALAADAAQERAGAVLCVATLDPRRRDVTVVAPVPLSRSHTTT